MDTIIDTTLDIIHGMGLQAGRVTTQPGYAGLSIALPNNGQAFFIWSKMDEGDFHFKLARFWETDNPFAMIVCQSLPAAIAQTKVLTNQ